MTGFASRCGSGVIHRDRLETRDRVAFGAVVVRGDMVERLTQRTLAVVTESAARVGLRVVKRFARYVGPVLRGVTGLAIGGRRDMDRALADGIFAIVTGGASGRSHLAMVDLDLLPACRDVTIRTVIAGRQMIGGLTLGLRALSPQTVVTVNAGVRQTFEDSVKMAGLARRLGMGTSQRKGRLGVIEVLIDDNSTGSRLLLSGSGRDKLYQA